MGQSRHPATFAEVTDDCRRKIAEEQASGRYRPDEPGREKRPREASDDDRAEEEETGARHLKVKKCRVPAGYRGGSSGRNSIVKLRFGTPSEIYNSRRSVLFYGDGVVLADLV
ncbi:hypothetical protein GWI33_012277, partial [Rhynchophorus ferrugineus]